MGLDADHSTAVCAIMPASLRILTRAHLWFVPQVVDSENLVSLFVIVSKHSVKEWEGCYETLSSYVVSVQEWPGRDRTHNQPPHSVAARDLEQWRFFFFHIHKTETLAMAVGDGLSCTSLQLTRFDLSSCLAHSQHVRDTTRWSAGPVWDWSFDEATRAHQLSTPMLVLPEVWVPTCTSPPPLPTTTTITSLLLEVLVPSPDAE